MASKLRVDEIISNNSNVSIGTATFTGDVTGSTASFTGSVGIGTATFTGSVGIGTDTPSQELVVHGNTFTSVLIKSDRTSPNSQIGGFSFMNQAVGIITATINALVDGSLLFKAAGEERLRIDSAGAIGLSGSNYGTAGQVIKSNGNSAAPTWQNLHSFMFYGEQDTEHNIVTNTYTRLINFGTNDFSIGDASIAVFDESSGTLTIGADGAGYYYLEMHGGIDDVQAGDYAQCVIGKNGDSTSVGTRISTYGRGWNSTSANQVVTASTSCMAFLSATDVIRFYVYHNESTDEKTEPNRCSVMGYKL